MKQVIELTLEDKTLTTEQQAALADILRDAAEKVSKIANLRSVTVDKNVFWLRG